MAPARGGLKGVYRQRKKASKPAPKKKSKNAQPPQQGGAAEEDEYGAEEAALRQFDMDTSYGPCIGVTRLRRWDRAAAMGLRPPPHVRDLIIIQRRHHHDAGDCSSSCPPPPKSKSNSDSSGAGQSHQLDECLWEGKV